MRKDFRGGLPVVLAAGDGVEDSLAGWSEAYFRLEVTTSEASQKVQRRDLERFLAFMLLEECKSAWKRDPGQKTANSLNGFAESAHRGGSDRRRSEPHPA